MKLRLVLCRNHEWAKDEPAGSPSLFRLIQRVDELTKNPLEEAAAAGTAVISGGIASQDF